MYIAFCVKYSVFLSDFNETNIFVAVFRKYSDIKFYEIRPLGVESFHADGRRHLRTNRGTDGHRQT
jgi:hypothetical protein